MQPPVKFKCLKGKVYWGTALVQGADHDTFTPLNFIWARDRHRIYSYNRPLRGADPESFSVLSALFAKDRNRAYYLSGPIPEADPATFRALDPGCFTDAWGNLACQGYAADARRVFHHVLTIGKPRLLKTADVATFRVLDRGFALDSTNVYREGTRLPKADPEKFKPLGHYYSTDGVRVYYGNTLISGADAETFQVAPDSQLRASDKNRQYDRHEVMC